MADKDQKTVSVVCNHPSGLSLRIFRETEREGMKQHLPVGGSVELKEGLNENVDKAFMDAWMADENNKDLLGMVQLSDGNEPTFPEDRSMHPVTAAPAPAPVKAPAPAPVKKG